jgi:6-phosphogluconate dehydrogenase
MMIGVGNMGGMMSLLFAEYGIEVHFYDPSEKNAQLLLDHAKAANTQSKIVHQEDYQKLCQSLNKPKVFVFSIPHGSVRNKTVDGLRPYLEKGDIILDASNEY